MYYCLSNKRFYLLFMPPKDQSQNTSPSLHVLQQAILLFNSRKELVFCNEAAEKLLGYTFSELREQPLPDLITPDNLTGNMRSQLKKNIPWKGSLSLKNKAGEPFLCELTMSAVKNDQECGTLFQLQKSESQPPADSAEPADKTKEMANSKNRFQAILSTIPDMIFVLDVHGNFLDFFAPKDSPLALKPNQIIGMNVTDVFTATESEKQLNLYRKCLQTHETLTNEYNLVIHGERMWFEARISPLSKNQILAVVRDVSEGKKMQDELKYRANLQSLLTELGNRFINIRPAEVDEAINEAMAKIGNFTGVDRIYLFDYNWEKEIMVNTYEWCSEGITPEIDNLQAVPNHLVPDWVSAHLRGETIYVPDVMALDPDDNLRKILEPQNIQSLTTMPMSYQGHCLGYIGFDAVKKKRSWSKDEMAILQLFTELLTNLRIKGDVEKKLDESEALNRFIASNISDAVILADSRGHYKYISPSHKKITGRGEEVLKRSLLEHVHPEDRERVTTAIREGRKQGHETKVAYRYLHPEKGYIWLESVGRRHYNPQGELRGLITTRDITDRKKVEQELLRLSRAVEQSPVSILITDSDGCIEYVNPVFTERTGYSLQEVAGKTPPMLKSELTPNETHEEIWQKIKHGKTWKGELCNKKKNGEHFWEQTSITPIIDNEGHIINFLSVNEDITEKKQLIDALIEAKEKAEESNRLKTAFINTISHEIRTPLNGIVGFSNLLIDPQIDMQTKLEYVDNIEESSDRLLDTVMDILEISMIVTGTKQLRPKPFNINEMLQDVYTLYNRPAKTGDNDFELILLTQSAATINSDEASIRTILNELLTNAFKFTRQGKVILGTDYQNDNLVIFVRDTGAGISKEHQNRIFDPFTHSGPSFTKQYEGSGLGLSIVKGLTDMLGGQIDLESEINKGTTFSIELPMNPPESEKSNDEVSKLKLTKETDKILVVEDEEMNFLYLKRILDMQQIAQVIHVTNGRKAVDICIADTSIQIVLMDLKLPVLGGLEASRMIKQNRPELPIIAITAYAMDTDREKALAAGCDAYLSKPYSKEELIAVLAQFVDVKKNHK